MLLRQQNHSKDYLSGTTTEDFGQAPLTGRVCIAPYAVVCAAA
ncbi:hypothetical protein [Niabella agricola]|nr:hypothetical protein [Niabella agricola]